MSDMDIMRPVGRLEKCSTARNILGFYRSVIVTCRYSLKRQISHVQIKSLLFVALRNAVIQHAALCCSILDEATEHPTIRLLKTIDLQELVTFVPFAKGDDLQHQLGQHHDQKWNNLDQRPTWRLIVFEHPEKDSAVAVDIAFVFHHALMDGLAGAAFHRTLLQALRRSPTFLGADIDRNSIIQIPRNVKLTEPLEGLVKLPLSWTFLGRQVFQQYAWGWLTRSSENLWAGANCQTLEQVPYQNRVQIHSMNPTKVADLLVAARSKGTTLTALITGTIVVALATALPDAGRFVGGTPYTMRTFCGSSRNDIVNQTSAFSTNYNKRLLDCIRGSSNNPEDRLDHIWKVAHHFKKEMDAELAKRPKDNMIGLLPYVSSHLDLFRKKIGQPREVTFEVSNLGSFDAPAETGDDGQPSHVWTMEDMLFSQGASVTGPAFTVNCASVRGGSLNLAFVWQDSIVEDAVIHAVVREFEELVI